MVSVSRLVGRWEGGSLVYHPHPSPDMQPHLPRDVDVEGADSSTIGEMFYFKDWTSPAGSDAMTIGRRRPRGVMGVGRGGGGTSSGRRYSRCGGGGEGTSPVNTPLGASSRGREAIRRLLYGIPRCVKKIPSGCRPSVSQSSGTGPVRGGDGVPPPHRMARRGGGSGRVGEEVLEAP